MDRPTAHDFRTEPRSIRTPDQRLRVFISSTLAELQPERAAARTAVESLRLAPVMFELGSRPHPPRSLYRSYLEQSDVFLGIYWQSYGWIGPGEEISGLEDEYRLSAGIPSLIYIKSPAPGREARLSELLDRIRADDRVSYKSFRDAEELGELIANDLVTLLAERFDATRAGDGPDRSVRRAPIPSAYTSIVGRSREREEILGMLGRPDVRLVTLVGPGGIGKSRLAIDVASAVAGEGVDVAFVLLETETSADAVLPGIARALGLRDIAHASVEAALVNALQSRRLLLVLDNMEQLLDASTDLVRLLNALPALTVLVTSRSPLRVRAEHVFEVGPLDVPADDAETADSPAVQLFSERAAAAHPGFRLTDADARTIARICRRLDGLPLAIELAAARVRSLAPAEVLTRLDSAWSLLTDGARDLPPRQRTIRSTIGWSVDLLDERARIALAALAVFTGPFTREAAEFVLAGVPGTDPSALDALADASLLQQRERGGVRLFTLLSLVREFALDLEGGPAPGEEGPTERWVTYYRGVMANAAGRLSGDGQVEWLRRLNAETENVTQVLRFLIDARRIREAAELAWSMYLFVWMSGMLGLMQAWMTEMLASAEREGVPIDPRSEAVGLYYTSAVGFWQDPERDVVPGLTRSADLFAQTGDAASAALARISIGLAFLARPEGPDVSAAERTVGDAVAGFRDGGDRWGEAMALVVLGRVDMMRGALEDATSRFARSLELAEQEHELLGIAIARHHRGWVRFAGGDLAGAEADFGAGLDGSLMLEHDEGVAYGLEGLGGVAAARGDAECAGLLLGSAGAVRRRTGLVNTANFAPYTPLLEAMRTDGRGALLDDALARGATMAPREVLDAVHG
ncbi:DUF4062 domain-containing protein [Microbacterium caowuchunii]|uniref:DUF4062 domain-containing protein n=1 Tax=Microbacterium caowuchunii TaxID=2614638 RepID=UPI001246B20E|nr:DUF4062 domain-containing protein [Microbacterium caowuchunii]QEV98853.1 DUF4062 domain-containing protein [Microbacterium caowuchunii]